MKKTGSKSFKGAQEECWECLLRLLEKTVKLAALSEDVERRARDEALKILKEKFRPGAIPAFIATSFQEKIREITGSSDPFLELKRQEMKIAKKLSAWLKPMYDNNFYSLFAFSALGNALDFFRDPEELKRDGEAGISFCIDDLKEVRKVVSNEKGTILLLADNAGEIYFDIPLLEYLKQMGCNPVYVVKEGAVQNDLTIDDVKWAGYDRGTIPVVSNGTSVVGLDLKRVSNKFRGLMDKATLVIGKGMGHFETMSHLSLKPRVLFLLKAKCIPVALSLGVQKDCFIAMLKK